MKYLIAILLLLSAGVARAGVFTWSDSGVPEGWLLELPPDTSEYLYVEHMSYPASGNNFYTIYQTTESVTVYKSSSSGGGGWPMYIADEYIKWLKIYYPIEKTECFEWEPIIWYSNEDADCKSKWIYYRRETGTQSDYFADMRYPPNCKDPPTKKCKSEFLYFKDGSVKWRPVEISTQNIGKAK